MVQWVSASLPISPAMTEAVNSTGGMGIVFHPQTPQLVLLGSSLTLNCSFDIKAEPDRVRVNWWLSKTQNSVCQGLKVLTSLANKSVDLGTSGPVTQWMEHTGTLRDIASNYSGWYSCQVVMEIPDFQQSCSNGTEVNISE